MGGLPTRHRMVKPNVVRGRFYDLIPIKQQSDYEDSRTPLSPVGSVGRFTVSDYHLYFNPFLRHFQLFTGYLYVTKQTQRLDYIVKNKDFDEENVFVQMLFNVTLFSNTKNQQYIKDIIVSLGYENHLNAFNAAVMFANKQEDEFNKYVEDTDFGEESPEGNLDTYTFTKKVSFNWGSYFDSKAPSPFYNEKLASLDQTSAFDKLDAITSEMNAMKTALNNQTIKLNIKLNGVNNA